VTGIADRLLPALARLLLALLLLAPVPAAAQELLLNRSFESAVTPVPVNGNNFYTTIPNWSLTNVSPPNALPFNLVRPHSGYAGNPTVTPTGGGSIYFDVHAAAGVLVQTVTVPSQGMIDISGWFSVRDNQQALSGLTLNVRNSSNVVVATASTSFVATDPIGLWKQASASNIPIAAGTYTFEVTVPNPANVDLLSMRFKPSLTVTKNSSTISDLVSLTNPKSIPGSITEYVISASSPSSYSVSNNSLLVADTTPANTALIVSDIGGAGSGPAAFTAGTSTLTYTFTGLASTTDDIEFSNNGGVSWTYVPVADANGTDAAVTTVRLRPKGTMAASSNFSFRLRYRLN
jgi:hypothetical protein